MSMALAKRFAIPFNNTNSCMFRSTRSPHQFKRDCKKRGINPSLMPGFTEKATAVDVTLIGLDHEDAMETQSFIASMLQCNGGTLRVMEI